MNDVGRRDEKTHCECREVEYRLQQLEDPARQPGQAKPSYDVEKARVELDAATEEAGGIEVVRDRAYRQINRLGEDGPREICSVVGHGRP